MAINGLKDIAVQQAKQQADMMTRRMANTLASYNRGYNFYVEINGNGFSFTKVSGLENTARLETIQEGGYNYSAHHLRTPVDGSRVLTLEYGSTNLNFMLDQLEPGRYIPDGVYITTLSHNSLLSGKMICLEGCYVQRISLGDLDAERSSLLINRMEIVYSSISFPSVL